MINKSIPEKITELMENIEKCKLNNDDKDIGFILEDLADMRSNIIKHNKKDNTEPEYKSGDKVYYKSIASIWPAEVIGIADKKDFRETDHAVSITKPNGKIINKVVKKSVLLPRKEKDKLSIGDRFEAIGHTHKILFKTVNQEDYFTRENGQVLYITRVLDGTKEGTVGYIFADDIERITQINGVSL
ncbi:MAG: hypothetical protein K9K32_07645 [Halanaerobiales bacterium]|nr:hypothetical protein [Halanaerobiales bacterium]